MAKENPKEKKLKVKIFWSPAFRKEPFVGEAFAVSSRNPLGDFDILPGHINFISLIFNFLTVHLPERKKITHRFKRGVLEVSEDKVNIFLGL